MGRTRIHDGQVVDESFISEREFNDFYSQVVITGTEGTDDTELTTTFDDYLPGRGIFIGSDGNTVATGTGFIDVSGFRGEFVAASGSLQTQIDVVESSDVDSVNAATGAITITGSSNFPIRTEGQIITVSGADHIENNKHANDGGLVDGLAHNITIASDGATITLTLDRVDGEPTEFVQISGSSVAHAVPDTVSLTAAGTDTNPQENWIFLQESAGSLTLTSNTTGFPQAAHARVATALVQTAQGVSASGVLKLHAYTDHISEPLSRGSVGHTFAISERIRAQHAQWRSGAALTTTVDTGPTPDSVTVQTAVGVALQLHTHTFPAMDTSASDLVFVFNDNTAPYKTVASLSEISEYSDGSSIGIADRFNVVIWGAISENQADSKLFLNLPAAGYNNDSKASEDTDNTAVFTIPSIFTGTGFLIARLTLKRAGGGNTWTVINSLDLRGSTPSTFPGGVAVGGGGVTDHGLLTGLTDDDHTQYLLEDGSRPISADWDNIGQRIRNTGTAEVVSSAPSTPATGLFWLDTSEPALDTETISLQTAYDNADGVIVTSGSKPVDIQGVSGLSANIGTFSQTLTISGVPVNINLSEAHPFVGDDGITVASGVSFDTISGFRNEFISTSGSLQTQLDAIDSSVTLQDAYDNGDGVIIADVAKPFQVTGSGIITGDLDVSEDLTVVGSLTAKGLTYPTTDGDSAQVIQTDGAGVLSFVDQDATKTLIIEKLRDDEDASFFFTPVARTVDALIPTIAGATASGTTWTVRYDSDRQAVGTEVVTGGTNTHSGTGGNSGTQITSFDNPSIPANNFVWMETSTASGIIDEFSLTLV